MTTTLQVFKRKACCLLWRRFRVYFKLADTACTWPSFACADIKILPCQRARSCTAAQVALHRSEVGSIRESAWLSTCRAGKRDSELGKREQQGQGWLQDQHHSHVGAERNAAFGCLRTSLSWKVAGLGSQVTPAAAEPPGCVSGGCGNTGSAAASLVDGAIRICVPGQAARKSGRCTRCSTCTSRMELLRSWSRADIVRAGNIQPHICP